MNNNFKKGSIWEQLQVLIYQPLGAGGYSKVYLAKHAKTHHPYALKVMDANRLSPMEHKNLKSEIEIHRNLDHPNIIKFIDCLQINNYIFILLEYAEKGFLFDFIQKSGGLPEKIGARVIYNVM